MRTRSQSRKLAELPAGSGSSAGFGAYPAAISGPSAGSGADPPAGLSLANPRLPLCGSVEIANANQLRRCCSESGRPRIEAKTRLRKWRDWANLPTELVEDIAIRLLTVDVSEYLRLRSACNPWRQCTDDPSLSGGGLDPRFRPHNWIALSYCASPSRRRLVNICTGARAEVDRPELSTHHCFGIVDGLLVLCDKATSVVRLLNPLTGALTHFPAITDGRPVTKKTPYWGPFNLIFRSWDDIVTEEMCDDVVIDNTPKINVSDPSAINGAAIDDSTNPPTLILALRNRLNRIICAKPGDQDWVCVHFGEQREPFYNNKGKIKFHSLLSFRGHCYVTTSHGHVMQVDLHSRPRPRMLYLSREFPVSSQTNSYSYLVRSHDHRMLIMVRFLSCIDLEHDRYPPEEMFLTRNGTVSSRMEVFEVDVVGRWLIPLNGIGHYAAFIGRTYSVMLAADKFPKLAPDAVYLNYNNQNLSKFGMYHFKDRRISPPREFTQATNRRLLPCACHWELADYLIVDIERRI